MIPNSTIPILAIDLPALLVDQRLYAGIGVIVLAYLLYRVFRWMVQNAPAESTPDDPRQAAQRLMQQGQFAEAIRIYSDLKDFNRAAGAYVQLKNFYRAAEMYLRARNFEKAGHFFKKAGNLAEAAQAYEDGGLYELASAEFEEIGDKQKAEKNRRKSRQEPAVAPTSLLQDREQRKKKAASLADNGAFQEAAELYRDLQWYDKAAVLFEKAKLWTDGAKAYMKLDDHRAAARCYFNAQLDNQAIEALKAAPDPRIAAAFLAAHRRLYSAGRFYESAGAFPEALECYQRVNTTDPRFVDSMERATALAMRLKQLDIVANRLREVTAVRQPTVESLKLFTLYARLLVNSGDSAAAGAIYWRLVDLQLLSPQMIPEVCRDRGDTILPPIAGNPDLPAPVARAEPMTTHQPSGPSIAEVQSFTPVVSSPSEDGVVSLPGKSIKRSDSLPGAVASSGKSQKWTPTDKELAKGLNPGMRYKVHQKIGEGGVGEVYLADDKVLNRPVVIKLLRNQKTNDQRVRKYFMQEARIAASLSHPNIVTVFDIGMYQDRPFIAMEYVKGPTLKRMLAKQPLMAPELARRIMAQLCNALEYAHNQMVVHRDIKAENVMVTEVGTVKLMDFGLAKILAGPPGSSTFCGTPHYMAPEIINGQFLDHRVDLYALGVLLFRIFTGRFPFEKEHALTQHLTTEPPDPLQLNPRLKPALAAVILKCLQKDRNLRYSTAPELKKAILSAFNA